MKKKYAYLFPINTLASGAKIVWSSETAESLPKRSSNSESDNHLIQEFIEYGKIGSFIQLSTGEFVFQIA